MFLTSLKQTCNEYLIKLSENQSAPKLENRKTSPCSPCAPNLLHVLVSRIVGYQNLCSPACPPPALCILYTHTPHMALTCDVPYNTTYKYTLYTAPYILERFSLHPLYPCSPYGTNLWWISVTFVTIFPIRHKWRMLYLLSSETPHILHMTQDYLACNNATFSYSPKGTVLPNL